MEAPADEQLAVLARVLDILRSLGIEHMVSGSIAGSYYTQPRMTRDIDLVIDLPPSSAAGLAQGLAQEFYCDAGALERAASNQSMANAIHDDTLLKIDFIVRKDDPYHREEFARRVTRQLGTVTADVVTAEDLIIAKLLWLKQGNSPLQRLDLEHLVHDVDGLDWSYVGHWTATLGVAALLAEVRA